MKTRFSAKATAAAVVAVLGSTALAAAPSQAAPALGRTSLASVLTAKASFDSDGANYDIVTAAVVAVLAAKPDSPVKVLTQGSTALTAFIPNDTAFQTLVSELTGEAAVSEADTFAAVAGLGIDTVEQVLQYHLIPGATITSSMALASDGATLTTLLPSKTVSVSVSGTTITLGDYDPLGADPVVILSQVDINGGNRQIAHGIDAVLLPDALIPALYSRSLATVLTAKSSFDTDGTNYDIVTAAVLAVLAAKPDSPVKVLTQGSTALTAFIPNDTAFQNLVSQLTGNAIASESDTFAAVAGLGIDTVEQVLQYHVVPGVTLLAAAALTSDGASLATALAEKNIGVGVSGTTITLSDYDPVASNPTVILSQVDINSGNYQVAHGIDAVLLPVALLPEIGSRSLAAVLTAKSSFDSDRTNYDIVTAAVLAVLAARPDSPVKVLTEGSTALTAFIPNDAAFVSLARKVSGRRIKSEGVAFAYLARLGIPALERILTYHVVPGATIVSEDALQANGATLATAASGRVIWVRVSGTVIQLRDYSRLASPKVILGQVDINRGNYQIAHGIDRVLLPTRWYRYNLRRG